MRSVTRRALARLAEALHEARIPFRLGGSGLLYACGLIEDVGDVDLVFPAHVREPLGRILESLSGTSPDFTVTQEPGFASAWRCAHRIDGQDFDLTGGDAVVVSGRRVELPFSAGDVWEVDGVDVPLASAETWWLVYRVHGVSERAALLAEAAGEKVIAGFLERLGIEEAQLP